MVGKTLGKYRIVERIGRGGMGVVYRALDETLDRQVAIKAISRLVETIWCAIPRQPSLARVNHPNMPPSSSCSATTTTCDGDGAGERPDLRAAIDRGAPCRSSGRRRSPARFSTPRPRTAPGSHRDLKPANLMLMTPASSR
jgi:serine/threonine protein kinase